jgi:hypothetical protein
MLGLRKKGSPRNFRVQQRELSRAAIERITAGIAKATDRLLKHLDSAHENISISAAESIITFAQKSLEHEELEQRLQKLERRILESEQKTRS